MTRLAMLLALVLALHVAPAQAQTDVQGISVEGSASRQVPNETGRFTASVAARRRSAAAALAATARRTRRVLAQLTALGIERRDTRTSSVAVDRVFRRDPKTRRTRLVGYRASNSVRVTIRDLSKAGAAIDAAVRAGASGIGRLTFFPADTDAIYREVLGEAFDDARAKAELLAARAGVTLGPARFISEGRDEFFDSGGGGSERGAALPDAPTPVRPGRTTVEASVSVLFDIS